MTEQASQQVPIIPTENKEIFRRRKLLPWWIKFFIWVFMLMGAISPIVLIAGFFGLRGDLAAFGLETSNPTSLVGIFLILTFVFFGIIGFGLWTEKVWAIKLAKIGALYGIAVCVFMMIIYPFLMANTGIHINIRLELILLIPYFYKLKKIQKQWEGNKFMKTPEKVESASSSNI